MDTIGWVTSYLVTIVCSAGLLYTLKKWKNMSWKKMGREKVYFAFLPVMLLLMNSCYIFLAEEPLQYTLWKYIIILGVLWVIAYIDFKEQIIPNKYLLMAIIIRGIIFIIELITDLSGAVTTIIAEGLGSLILLSVCILIRFLSRKGLGMGDVKLFAVLPLFLGLVNGVRAFLYAMIIVFIQACFCLITRKKGKKDVLPFAPAIAAGAWITVFLAVI